MDTCPPILRSLATGDDGIVELLTDERENLAASALDAKAHALVRVGALIGLDLCAQAFRAPLQAARLAGASNEEIVGTLVAALGVVGAPTVASAAPELALALGYDLDYDLEST